MGIFSKGSVEHGNKQEKTPELFSPDTVTSANLADIERMMAHNLLISKLCSAAISTTKLPDLKKTVESIRSDHLKQLSNLLEFLNKGKEGAS
ncbi:hypothetical protein [Edaphobacillus lindanitolerans]|uniref:Uncharacterized protein n=1 Tax=Edaphobacillus lindanitolerans TaxID=550447 RepID=A0A1U7PT79_9BACI|nr:hypothetical protein [Edaphobacillus lindanitolerans]SIT91375.1 hypothetical protein SAMN05428946_2668 [Edaphobacillus lindanitolerans]